MQPKRLIVVGVLLACRIAFAQSAQDTSHPSGASSTTATQLQSTPQPYTTVRWDEDYSYLKDPARRTDFFDPVKYIPLDEKGDVYLSTGAQFRERYEWFNHNTFGAGPQDRDGYFLTRLFVHADAHIGPYVRVFVMGRGAFENGREGGPRGNDLDQNDIEQGFFDIRLPVSDTTAFTLRTGRQNMPLGRERLIGISDWSNARRTFDGFRGMLKSPNNSLDVFIVRPVQVERYDFDSNDNHTVFAGIYDTLSLQSFIPVGNPKLDLYALSLRRNNATYPVELGAGTEERYTLGTRFFGNPKPFDFDVEADYQFGSFKSGQIHAYSLALEGGYTIDPLPLHPRAYLGFDIASGDNHPGDGNVGTFNQLFPSGHTYFGYIDAIGRQNIIDLHPGVDLPLLRNRPFVQKLDLRTEYHQFWRQSNRDAVYNTSAAVLRAPGTSTSRSIGSELDLLLNWQVDRHLSSYFGYSHFFAGPFLGDTGAHRDIDFLYAAVVFTF